MSLDEEDAIILSPSYFWSCITLSEDCPFFTTIDPKIHYFGFTVAALYAIFLIIVISDLGFFWSLDNMQRKIEYYVKLVTSKTNRVQMNQRKLITMQERTEKQLRKSRDSTRMLTCLRGAMCAGDPHVLNLPSTCEDTSASDESAWSNVKNFVEF